MTGAALNSVVIRISLTVQEGDVGGLHQVSLLQNIRSSNPINITTYVSIAKQADNGSV